MDTQWASGMGLHRRRSSATRYGSWWPPIFLCVAFLTVGERDIAMGAVEECADPGAATPVLLVHGFNSSSEVFSEYYSGLMTALEDEGRATVDLFDYSETSRHWVTPETAAQLTAQVDCLASRSAANGGPGKVILVGHSMGGLVIRGALQYPGVPGEVSAVVTIGTPHVGALDYLTLGALDSTDARFLENSILARVLDRLCPDSNLLACNVPKQLLSSARSALRAGSVELQDLGKVPGSIPFFAVAGDVGLQVNLFELQIGGAASLGSDLVVSVASATAGADSDHQLVVECPSIDAADLLLTLSTDGPSKAVQPACWHGRLVEHPQVIDYVRGIVKAFGGCGQTECGTGGTEPPSDTAPPEPLSNEYVAEAFITAVMEGNDPVAESYFKALAGDYGPRTYDDNPAVALPGFTGLNLESCADTDPNLGPDLPVDVSICDFTVFWGDGDSIVLVVEMWQDDEGEWWVWFAWEEE